MIDIAVRGLPHACRDVSAEAGAAIAIDISGASGGQWTLIRDADRWMLSRGEASAATTRVRLDDDAAWKLLFNALPERDAARVVRIEGRADLAVALLQARSVIV